MQRILRINLQARNQAAKAARRKEYDTYRKDWKDYQRRYNIREKAQNELIKAEKKARKEDWILGSLAPRRDVGVNQDLYGTVKNLLYQGPVFPSKVRYGPKGNSWDDVPDGEKLWEGLGNEGNIVVGDRVCVVKGKDSLIGQIGKVKEVLSDTKELRLEGLNMADIMIPESYAEQREKLHFSSLELPISITDVRLVHRLTDETTGKDRDVIVKIVRGGAPYIQQNVNSPLPRHTRYIAGEDIEIPWPQADITEYEAFEGDTTRYDVEARTWQPTVYGPPIPEVSGSHDIFGELYQGEKYKRDRTWHEDEYVKTKVLEDARAEWYRERKMQGPLETWRDERLRRASERTARIKASGMSEETEMLIRAHMKVPAASNSHAKTRRKVKALA